MRYAVYFTPPQDDALTKAAAAWLGRDAFTGETLAPPAVPDLTLEAWRMLVAEPARYGFHATLKAPFSLAPGRTEEELVAAFDSFVAATPATVIPELTLSSLGAFFALTPGEDSAAIDDLAAKIVRYFEIFRAPLSPEDIARRNPDKLTERKRAHLERWGYPSVFEDFRFHMTLTGQVPPEDQEQVRDILSPRFADFTGRPLPISHLGLFAEPERGAPFTVMKVALLGGAS
ncbi:DUF1045 domain-containing protein [Rhizobium oryzicola]|uniref:DUF1045 domain-containing protein n=1 Tax=Rhizobium oryzicola TaxID=1232668 RepID=A0ABT8SRU2_9HYPH|nr:DUF1045 domain-containing protein [Rhizobium oryzicola]MDO1580598.1 DUF1045 domain-containing protein [Rhizobium oryzicola]